MSGEAGSQTDQSKKTPAQWRGATSGENIPAAGAGTPPAGDAGAGTPAGTPPAGTPPGDESQAGADDKRTKTSDLPDEALQERLKREREKGARDAEARLFKELGVSGDFAAWKAEQQQRIERAQKLEAEEEKRKRAQMTELDRTKADLGRANRELEEARAKIADLEESQASQAQEVVVHAVALKAIDPEMYQYARMELIAHLEKLEQEDPAAFEAFDETKIEGFFVDLAKRKPKFAAAASSSAATDGNGDGKGAAEEKKTPTTPVRKMITTGAGPRAPVPPAANTPSGPDVVDGKTTRPGQPNSMSAKELRAHLKSKGMKSW